MNISSWSWPAWTWLLLVAAQPVVVFSVDKPSIPRTVNVPAHIATEAQRKQLPLSSIKRMGDSWVACINRAGSEVCIVLGNEPVAVVEASPGTSESRLDDLRTGDRLVIHKYGELAYETTVRAGDLQPSQRTVPIADVGHLAQAQNGHFTFVPFPDCQARITVYSRGTERVLDRLPRYQREGTRIVRTKDVNLVREYIDSHASEPFVVLVTVPSLCEPCRQMDQVFTSGAGVEPHTPAVKTFILEYFAFEDAERELLGPNALFPTTLVFGPATGTQRMLPSVVYGQTSGVPVEQHARMLREQFKRGAPAGMARGLLSRMSLSRLIDSGKSR